MCSMCMYGNTHTYTYISQVAQDSTCQCRRCRRCVLIPGSESSPGEGNGNPLQYFYLENPMDQGAWWATKSSLGCKVMDTQLSLGFSRQEYRSGLLFPPPRGSSQPRDQTLVPCTAGRFFTI